MERILLDLRFFFSVTFPVQTCPLFTWRVSPLLFPPKLNSACTLKIWEITCFIETLLVCMKTDVRGEKNGQFYLNLYLQVQLLKMYLLFFHIQEGYLHLCTWNLKKNYLIELWQRTDLQVPSTEVHVPCFWHWRSSSHPDKNIK